MKNIFPYHKLFLFAVLTLGISVKAQNEIDISKEIRPGTTKPIYVSLSGFSGEALEVLQLDLYVQGFNFTNADNAQYLITGSNEGNVQGRVTDRFNKATLAAKAYSGATLRRQAHAFTDEIVQAITGNKGIAQTQIAFKVDTGANSEIYVSDFDGRNPQQVTSDNTIVTAPSWVPRRQALYYSSYTFGNPAILYHDLSTGTRRKVAYYNGSSISPAASFDGSKVAMILSIGGSPDVYVSEPDGSNLSRLTQTRTDESSPCWSPDGKWICFATKINDRRALAKVSSSGGAVERITTIGASSPTEPDWSPDGKWIVFTQQWNDFQICVVPAKGGSVITLVSGEDPSWSPNSRTLVYVRRANGRRVLSLLDVPTKQSKDVSRISGSNSQPSWAK